MDSLILNPSLTKKLQSSEESLSAKLFELSIITVGSVPRQFTDGKILNTTRPVLGAAGYTQVLVCRYL